MGIEVGKFYTLVVSINNRILTYTCKIIEKEEPFITFVDKYGEIISYNTNQIVSFTEVKK
jgi:hypothetical protein